MNMSQRLFLEAFDAEVADVSEREPDSRRWSAAGRGKKKDLPNGEDGQWWRQNGPGMVENWITWRRKVAWKIWVTPDGTPAIELSQEFVTPQGRNIKGFIDRIFVIPGGQLVIVDLKSGQRTPESDLQLAFYRYSIYNTYGIDIRHGAYWMARTGQMSDIYNLTRITPALMAVWMERFDRAIGNEIFIPNVSFKCRACSHRDFCVAYGGSKAHMDPDYQIEEAA